MATTSNHSGRERDQNTNRLKPFVTSNGWLGWPSKLMAVVFLSGGDAGWKAATFALSCLHGAMLLFRIYVWCCFITSTPTIYLVLFVAVVDDKMCDIPCFFCAYSVNVYYIYYEIHNVYYFSRHMLSMTGFFFSSNPNSNYNCGPF